MREVATTPRAEFQHPAPGHGSENALVRPVIGVLGQFSQVVSPLAFTALRGLLPTAYLSQDSANDMR
ncbi:hypothetical protein [Streptomyces sp. NBC_00078]|uniref:hypothetical protein n=1 Tax=unclassified Streptomyces TaxID=2593676 RepID=UPI002254648B|nr:hypothetical protein [Streptomyces sp. NBC_00078]MCX5421607.1 hypothetical protein [Streptomyces sp. NBC_00078]